MQMRALGLWFVLLVGCEEAGGLDGEALGDEAPADSSLPSVDAGASAASDGSAALPVDSGELEHDAGVGAADHDASAPADAAVTADAALPMVDAATVVADASVAQDAAPSHLSYDASVPYFNRACSTAADCMDPFRIFENNTFVLMSLPRSSAPQDQPVCETKPGTPWKRCSFYCELGSSSFPDQKRWCTTGSTGQLAGGVQAQCLTVPGGAACFGP